MAISEDESAARQALAGRLQLAIEQRKLSHRRLAAAISVSKQSVTNWTQGTHEPSLRHLRRLAHVLGVPAAALIEHGEHSEHGQEQPADREATAILTDLSRLRMRPALQSLTDSAPALLDLLTEAERQVRNRQKPGAGSS